MVRGFYAGTGSPASSGAEVMNQPSQGPVSREAQCRVHVTGDSSWVPHFGCCFSGAAFWARPCPSDTFGQVQVHHSSGQTGCPPATTTTAGMVRERDSPPARDEIPVARRPSAREPGNSIASWKCTHALRAVTGASGGGDNAVAMNGPAERAAQPPASLHQKGDATPIG